MFYVQLGLKLLQRAFLEDDNYLQPKYLGWIGLFTGLFAKET